TKGASRRPAPPTRVMCADGVAVEMRRGERAVGFTRHYLAATHVGGLALNRRLNPLPLLAPRACWLRPVGASSPRQEALGRHHAEVSQDPRPTSDACHISRASGS